jgi:predicted amidophosphoribosyltransferase
MICKRCRKSFGANEALCPHCGEPKPESTGLFQTSTVLISAGGADLVYRSVDEVPARLRTQLLKSTNGANSATILIADQRGRKEIAKAMRKLPGPAQRR